MAETMERQDLIAAIEAVYGLCMVMRGRMVADSVVLDQLAKMVLEHLPEADTDLKAAMGQQIALCRRRIDNGKELGAFTARIEEFRSAIKAQKSAV
jgi:hypothetical protein